MLHNAPIRRAKIVNNTYNEMKTNKHEQEKRLIEQSLCRATGHC